VLITILCSCSDETEKLVYEPKYDDELQFLLNESDLITVLDITKSPNSHGGLSWLGILKSKEIKAKVKEVISGNITLGKTITLSNIPYYSKPNSSFHFLVIYKGNTYLAFLKLNQETGKYSPILGSSLHPIYGSDNIRPTWKNKKREVEIQLSEAVEEIKNKNI